MFEFRWKIFILLILIAAFRVSRSQNTDNSVCHQQKQLDFKCASYCFAVSKPLLQMAPECHSWDAELFELKDRRAELNKELAIYEEKEFQVQIVKEIVELKEKLNHIEASRNSTSDIDVSGKVKQLKDELTNCQNSLENCPTKDTSNQVSTLQTELETAYSKLSKCKNNNANNSVKNYEKQVIMLEDTDEFEVMCERIVEKGPCWMVMQRRVDNSVNFEQQEWINYRNGIGTPDGNYFMGLEKLYWLTKSGTCFLRIELETNKGTKFKLRYSDFKIGSEEELYMLKSLGKFYDIEGNSGNSGNALNSSLGDVFYVRNVTFNTRGEYGWWAGFNSNSNLNGKYGDQGIWWKDIKEIKTTKMLLRVKN